MSSSWTHYRARHAALSKHRPADDPDVASARRDLDVSLLEDHIQRVVASAPPLSPAQRDKLATLLRPVTTSGSGQQGGKS